ncbi:hypothetical protein CPAR01_15400 [Colletotrichum paranaense]|uniref:Uncharacterized protein n=2 Tax=Colletotrichum acutatum species complex TaxID=2707335 RepID=A0AAI9Y2V2_9PEZI|nr:uncharacterized protein CPAR01_15400 [Colletotrichum paranaense]KAK1468762.1 hypothetical protein CMEL01_00529 [Colletotrichum melonis]KAK1519907.1 hypothetical protein CPAR01_15400 [Colletotrichum paranaense]
MRAKSKQTGQFRRLSSSQGYLSMFRRVAFILHLFSFAYINPTPFDFAIQDLLRKLQTDGILDWVQRAGLRAVHLTLPPLEVRCLGPWTSTTANGRLDVAHWKQGTTQHLLATSTQLAFTTRRRLGDRQTTRENRSTEKRTSAIEAKSITSRRGVDFHCNSIKRPSPINHATQENYQQTLQCLPFPTTQEGDLPSFFYKCSSGVGFSSSPALLALPGFHQLRLPQAPKHQTISLQTEWSWDQNRTSRCQSHINTPYTNHTRSLAISMPFLIANQFLQSSPGKIQHDRPPSFPYHQNSVSSAHSPHHNPCRFDAFRLVHSSITHCHIKVSCKPTAGN